MAQMTTSKQDASGGVALKLYKPGQGAWLRWGTAIAAGALSIGMASFLAEQLRLVAALRELAPQTAIYVVTLVIAALLIFRLVGQSRKFVDFLVATEGEMKKVNWSTRREVFGATRVVIFTTLALSLMLFLADLLLMMLFSWIGVLQIDLVGRLFGTGDM